MYRIIKNDHKIYFILHGSFFLTKRIAFNLIGLSPTRQVIDIKNTT